MAIEPNQNPTRILNEAVLRPHEIPTSTNKKPHSVLVDDDTSLDKALDASTRALLLDNIKTLPEEVRKSQLNDISENNETHLSLAIKQKQFDHAEKLIGFGADINLQYRDGKTLLRRAVDNNDSELAQNLLTLGADVNASQDALPGAVSEEKLDILKILLEWKGKEGKKAEVNDLYRINDDLGVGLLHVASVKKKPEMCELLVKNGADVNLKDSNGNTSLHIAAIQKDVNTTKTLVELGADVNAKNQEGKDALYQAVKKRNLSLLKILLEGKGEGGQKANVNGQYQAHINGKDDNITLLHIATHFNNTEMCKALKESGANLEAKTTAEGLTPLHLAAANGKMEALKTLVELGADIYAKDKTGYTPLDKAIKNGHVEIAKALAKEYSAEKINEKSRTYYDNGLNRSEDRTALHRAIRSNSGNPNSTKAMEEVLKIFIEKESEKKERVNVRIANSHRETPLAEASLLAPEAVPILLNAQNGKDAVNTDESIYRQPLYNAILSCYNKENDTLEANNVRSLIKAGARCTNELVKLTKRPNDPNFKFPEEVAELIRETAKRQSSENTILNKIGNFLKGKNSNKVSPLNPETITHPEAVEQKTKQSRYFSAESVTAPKAVEKTVESKKSISFADRLKKMFLSKREKIVPFDNIMPGAETTSKGPQKERENER
ncbi:MAG: ankyrin repeat domain-containing protein [Rickettsiaceae bacterium]|nr:ankyrin repeat domain-containing protein [Rickettsiaceae bacterium]